MTYHSTITRETGAKIDAGNLNSAEKRTDMAFELLGDETDAATSFEIYYSKINVDKEMSRAINRPQGVYITLQTAIAAKGNTLKYEALSKAISSAVRELAPNSKSVLIVGLGNPNLTADALGSRVFENLTVTRHLPDEIKSKISLSALCPNVMGATGIESFDIIKGVVDRVKPDLIIAVDSLASAAVGRIGSAFQICSGGITPGSGVANHRLRLDKNSLGIDVISIGVPLVVYASTIIAEAAGTPLNLDDEIKNLIVTPKDIDILVDECGKIIASAINRTFVPEFKS